MSQPRLVLKKGEESLEPLFSHCLVDFFNKKRNFVNVKYSEEKGTLIIEEDVSSGCIRLSHSSECPMRYLHLNGEIKFVRNHSPLKVAAAVVIESSDSYALLTERDIMRWYCPCNWTFPGGHLDPGETIIEGAIREVKKETGLDISNLKFTMLGFWEHVYPFYLTLCNPSFHCLIAYLHVSMDESHQDLMDKIKPNSKVKAYSWMKFSVFNDLFTTTTPNSRNPLVKQYYYDDHKWVEKSKLCSTMFEPSFWCPRAPKYGVTYAVNEWKRKKFREGYFYYIYLYKGPGSEKPNAQHTRNGSVERRRTDFFAFLRVLWMDLLRI